MGRVALTWRAACTGHVELRRKLACTGTFTASLGLSRGFCTAWSDPRRGHERSWLWVRRPRSVLSPGPVRRPSVSALGRGTCRRPWLGRSLSSPIACPPAAESPAKHRTHDITVTHLVWTVTVGRALPRGRAAPSRGCLRQRQPRRGAADVGGARWSGTSDWPPWRRGRPTCASLPSRGWVTYQRPLRGVVSGEPGGGGQDWRHVGGGAGCAGGPAGGLDLGAGQGRQVRAADRGVPRTDPVYADQF